jgi:hypothetical protein
MLYQAVYDSSDPVTVQDAISRQDSEEWKHAMRKELESQKENKVWELVDMPAGAKVVRSKYIFKIKRDSDGNTWYKARLVAKGCCTQSRGIDYFEICGPVVRRSTVRMLAALAVRLDLQIDHFDVTTAFLHGWLGEKVVMVQPEGCMEKGSENKMCLLNKAIYGLKQPCRTWN